MNRKIRGTCAGVVALLGLMASAPQALAQAKTEISLSRQPGIFYMPTHIIEKQKLIEKHAGLLGLPNITTKWINFSGGGAQTDALLAGGVDILNTGTGNLLLRQHRAAWSSRRLCGVVEFPARGPQPLLDSALHLP